MRRLFLMSALICVAAVPCLQAESLDLDLEGSKISFVGTKKDGKHDGGFKKFSADVDVNWEDPASSTLSMKIDATSIWSDNPKLTNHLKNPDFFDVRKYPEIKFEATKLEPGEENKGKMTGELTLLGKTEEVEMSVVSEASESMLMVRSEFKIDRTKWGMDYGQGKVDNDVSVKVQLKFKR
ncbi:MAG: YceI family protein [Planctomycetota bacterium]